MRAYNETYLSHAADTLGTMMAFAVNDCGLDGDVFAHMFVVSGVAGQFERGNPKYIAGKSGAELFFDVVQKGAFDVETSASNYRDYRTADYWAGWALAQYQWFTAKTFASILRVLPFSEIVNLYPTLHEADITKFFDVASGIFERESPETNLKRIRGVAGLSQSGLAKEAGVALRSIQMYEQRKKDINKAQAVTLAKIARTLGCNVEDLLESEG
ncbi:MAG: helix-turn-helix domain-containing protein [Clostridiales bacterium]|nr:helix-turn-helix domain-containing protein [Clostridiales bacterium]